MNSSGDRVTNDNTGGRFRHAHTTTIPLLPCHNLGQLSALITRPTSAVPCVTLYVGEGHGSGCGVDHDLGSSECYFAGSGRGMKQDQEDTQEQKDDLQLSSETSQ